MWLDNNYVGAYTYVIPIYDGSTNSTSKYDLNLDDQYDKIPHQAIMNFVNQYDLPYVEITRFVCDTLTSLNNITIMCDTKILNRIENDDYSKELRVIVSHSHAHSDAVNITSSILQFHNIHEFVQKYMCIYSSNLELPVVLENDEILLLKSDKWKLLRKSVINRQLCGFDYINLPKSNLLMYLDVTFTNKVKPEPLLISELLMKRKFSYILPYYTIICVKKPLNLCLSSDSDSDSDCDCDSMNITLISCDSSQMMLMNRYTSHYLNEYIKRMTSMHPLLKQKSDLELLSISIAMSSFSSSSSSSSSVSITLQLVDTEVFIKDLMNPKSNGNNRMLLLQNSDSEVAILSNQVEYDRNSYLLFPWNVLPDNSVNAVGESEMEKCILQFPLNNTEFVIDSNDIIKLDVSFYVTSEYLVEMSSQSQSYPDADSERVYYVFLKYFDKELNILFSECFNVYISVCRMIVFIDDFNRDVFKNHPLDISVTVYYVNKNVNINNDDVHQLISDGKVNVDCTMTAMMTQALHQPRAIVDFVSDYVSGGDARHPQDLYDLSRIEFGLLLLALGYEEGITVEVGVYRGAFSEKFIRLLGNRSGTHFLVDPWMRQDNADIVNNQYGSNGIDTVFSDAMYAVKDYGNRVVALRSTSIYAADLFVDGTVDFVYIDAQHGYYNCMQDMLWWWHKVKPGGVFAGHDYDCFGGVSSAVDEFSRKMNVSVYLTNDNDYASYSPETNRYTDANIEYGENITCRSWYILK